MEWYRIRQRTISDVLAGRKSGDSNRRKTNKGIKEILRALGRIFVILPVISEKEINSSILIVDNGYTDIGHVLRAVKRSAEDFPNPDITLLTFASREHYFKGLFPEMSIVTVGQSWKYGLAGKMYALRRLRFTYVVLTTLDVSPVTTALLFMRTQVFLYNKWYQWWSLSLRNPLGYIKGVLRLLKSVPLFLYLLVTATIILLKTGFRLAFVSAGYNFRKK
jgi:hypothetical protein